MAEMIKS